MVISINNAEYLGDYKIKFILSPSPENLFLKVTPECG